jgi:hypothetical protein
MRRSAPVGLAVAMMLAVPLAAQHHDHRVSGPALADVVRFDTTCRATVAAVVDRGVHQVHTLAFDDALGNFRLAAHSDVDCAMAYWGTAMAHWGRFARSGRADALAEGWRALDQAALVRRPPSPRERRYLDALQGRFRDRLGAGAMSYATAMAALATDFPADPHAALLAAQAQLDQPAGSAAAATAAGRAALALLTAPAVPARHLTTLFQAIRAGDRPSLAGEVLTEARAVTGATEASPEVLIAAARVFERLGLWDETVATSQRAADAARAAAASEAELLALDLLVHGLLQQGQADAAHAVSRRLEAGYLADVPGAGAAWLRAALRARVALEAGDWRQAAALPTSGDDATGAAPIYVARAIGLARLGRAVDAEAAAARLARVPHEAGEGAAVGAVMAEVAAAWAAFAAGRQPEAIAAMAAAADREDDLPARGVWRRPLVPAREQLGELLLAAGRPREAATAFAATLERYPGRARARAGAGASTKPGRQPPG